MRKKIVLAILWGIVNSCTPSPKRRVSEERSRFLLEQDLEARLLYEKMLTDTLFNKGKDKLLILVKLLDQQKLVSVQHKQWPEGVETTYNVLTDSSGRIIRISEFPFSESGDWEMMYSHYFDSHGNTFAHERSI